MKKRSTFRDSTKSSVLEQYSFKELNEIEESQKAIPRVAKDKKIMNMVEDTLPRLPTWHDFYRDDATKMSFLKRNSVHLVLTSPPYWTLKKYNESEGQLGDIADYDSFLDELSKVWLRCYDALVPGGRLICVVGDVCLSRRKNKGRHVVIPLHSSIQEQCRKIGYDNLSPIIWHKIANANLEVKGSSSFLGKPYEPNAIIKNDIEFILMERKAPGYRKAAFVERLFSVIPEDKHKIWFNQIWTDLTGASTKDHPAPYPLKLATRLIRMYSFVGDIVLDPFHGSGTTAVAAARAGRNSISIELDKEYYQYAVDRFKRENNSLFSNIEIREL